MSFITMGIFIGTVMSAYVQAAFVLPLYACFQLVCRDRLRLVPLAFLMAFLSGSAWFWQQDAHRMKLSETVCDASLEGLVTSVRNHQNGQRLDVKIMRLMKSCPEARFLRKVRLSSADARIRFQKGQKIRVDVRLRAPRSFRNRLPFDYEASLMAAGIDASGYIRVVTEPADLTPVVEKEGAVNSWVAGLVYGESDGFTDQQWQLARTTGTLHLLVVSGLHLGLVALAGFAVTHLLYRLLVLFVPGWLPAWIMLPPVILFVLMYAASAGFGLSLQRATVMILIVLLFTFQRQRLNVVLGINLALSVLLVSNPLIWLNAGFWYSFTAVIALILVFSGRKSSRLDGVWLPQFVVFFAIMPLGLIWLQSASPLNIITNLFAVPVVSLLLLPLALIQAVAGWDWLDDLLILVGDGFWWWLQMMAGVVSADLAMPGVLAALVLALVLWLLSSGYPLRTVATTLLLTGLAWLPMRSATEDQVSLLDVGQGLSVVFVAAGDALVYDTGPRFRSGFSLGQAVVAPVLRQAGVSTVNVLVVSHSDNDHAGGLGGLLSSMSVQSVYAGQSLGFTSERLCEHQSLAWKVINNQLRWRILWLAGQQNEAADNNTSCVVQVVWYDYRFLLTGDIEATLEPSFIQAFGDELASDILVVGHHGSRSSTSERFVRQVNPSQGWISAGYANRFGHPHPEVVARLQSQGAEIRNTASEGRIIFTPDGQIRTAVDGLQPRWVNR